MRLLTLLTLLGVVIKCLATNRKLIYSFTTQTLMGIPELGNQYVGHIISGDLELYHPEEKARILQLRNTKYQVVNNALELSEDKDVLNQI